MMEKNYRKIYIFEIGVHDATVYFNISNLATLLSYDNVDMEGRFYTMNGCLGENRRHLKHAKQKDT